jgi:hypothetical protein
MSAIKLEESIFSIDKNPYLNRKRNISFNSQLSEKNSPSPKKQLFQVESLTNNQNTITETNDIVKDKTYNINKPIIKKGKWTEEEDSLLIKYVNKFGVGKWNIIERYIVGRTRKQIRQRYINNIKVKTISEEIKQNISCNSDSSSDEDESNNKDKDILKRLYKENNKKNIFKWDEKLDKILLKEYFLNKKSWVKISQKIPGSSENSVKNRFYSLLRQKVNKSKKEYSSISKSKSIFNNNEKNENNLLFLLQNDNSKDEILTNNINIGDNKEILFNKDYFESEYFNDKSKKKNYSLNILLEFLPELLEDKGIDINEIYNELKERKNIAAKNIFIVIEKHIDSYSNIDNNDLSSISTNLEFENLLNEQSEKLGKVIKNMKLKIMYKYFQRFRYNTLGI